MLQEDWDNIRQEMWNDLIPNLFFLTGNERKKAKRHFAAKLGKLPGEIHTKRELEKMNNLIAKEVDFGNEVQFVDFSPSAEICMSPCNKNKKEKAMCYDYDEMPKADPEALKREYLYSRAHSKFQEHDRELAKQFNIFDMDAPNSPKELAERLSKGLYVVDDAESDKEYTLFSWRDFFHWRDPAKPKDRVGYAAAYEELLKAKTALDDQNTIADPKDALAALQAFENWKPTASTTTAQ